jgi:hypothetical protein
MKKTHFTVHVDNRYTCAKSIFMYCNKAVTSKFDFQTHTQALSKHIHSALMFRFCFRSICGAIGIVETACRVILELPNRAHLHTSFGLTD